MQPGGELNSQHRYDLIRSSDPNRQNPFLRSPLQYANRVFSDIQDSVEALPIEQLTPIVAGKGSENVVFVIPNQELPAKLRGLVVKVNYRLVEPILYAYGIKDQEKTKRETEKMEMEVLKRKRRLEELKSYFGNEAVSAERTVIREVPVSSDIVTALGMNIPSSMKLPKSVLAPVSLQLRRDFSPYFKDKTWTEATGYYPEKQYGSIESRRVYHRGHRLCTGHSSEQPRTDVLRDLSLFFPDLDGMIRMIASEDVQLAKKGEALRKKIEKTKDEKKRLALESALQKLTPLTNALREFVPKLFKYTRETNIPLDLAGTHNLVFLKKEDEWKPKMLDVFPIQPLTIKDLENYIETIKTRRKDPEDDYELRTNQYDAMMILNSIRVMNAFALMAGIDDHLTVKGLDDIPAEVWGQGISAVL